MKALDGVFTVNSVSRHSHVTGPISGTCELKITPLGSFTVEK